MHAWTCGHGGKIPGVFGVAGTGIVGIPALGGISLGMGIRTAFGFTRQARWNGFRRFCMWTRCAMIGSGGTRGAVIRVIICISGKAEALAGTFLPCPQSINGAKFRGERDKLAHPGSRRRWPHRPKMPVQAAGLRVVYCSACRRRCTPQLRYAHAHLNAETVDGIPP
jgi:hypothetical protein